MLGIFLDAAILSGTLYLLARHEADYSFYKVAFLALGVSVVTALVHFGLRPYGIAWLAFPVGFALCAWALVRFCYVSWGKSLLVTAVYLVLSLAVSVGFGMLTRTLSP